MNIGKRIKEEREKAGLSVDDVAEALNKNRSTVYRYESNDIEKLPISLLEPLAKVLKTTPAHLMGWDTEVEFSSIGEKIKKLRTQQGYTQEELADAAKTTKQTIHKYETGIITNIPASKIKALADKLNSTPAYLMGWQTDVKETSTINLSKYTDHHIKVIDAYIAKPEMQPAVDKLLGVKSEGNVLSKHLPAIPNVAAQSGKKIKAGTPDLKALIKIEKSKKR